MGVRAGRGAAAAVALWVVGAPATAAAAGPVWVPPLAGPQVARGFDPPASTYGTGHRGVDLVGPPQGEVVAAGAGRVSYAGLLAGRGVVVVDHGELRTTYEPVAASVTVGTEVGAGDVLGALVTGHEGCSSSACLHWGLKRGDAYLDPMSLLGPRALRLLPLGSTGVAAARADRSAARVRDGVAGGVRATRAPAVAGPPAPTSPAATDSREEPAFALRASELPLAALSLGALALGVGLLRRPGVPPPDGPAGAGALRQPHQPVAAEGVQQSPGPAPLDLALERERRRRVA